MNPTIKWVGGGLGCLFALVTLAFFGVVILLALGLGGWWLLKKEPVSAPAPVAVVDPAPPAPAPVAVVTPPATVPVKPPVDISSEEMSIALNRPVGSGPEVHPTTSVARVVSLARATDPEHGAILVPNKAEGQAITVPTPTSPLPRFEFVGVDGSNLEPFVPGAQARSGRYYVVFRERQ